MPEMQATIRVRGVLVERAVPAGLLAAGRFDLDDGGTQTREDLAAILGEFVGELDDAQAVEKTSVAGDCGLGQWCAFLVAVRSGRTPCTRGPAADVSRREEGSDGCRGWS